MKFLPELYLSLLKGKYLKRIYEIFYYYHLYISTISVILLYKFQPDYIIKILQEPSTGHKVLV